MRRQFPSSTTRVRASDDAGLIAAYTVAASRYASTTAFQWQVPAFGAAAEGALLAGTLGSDEQVVRLVLCGVAAVLAPAAIGVMRRAELTAWWDRSLMDEYERLLVPAELRLHHELNLMQRLGKRRFSLNKTDRSRKVQLLLVRLAPPSFLLGLSLLVLAAANVAIAVINP